MAMGEELPVQTVTQTCPVNIQGSPSSRKRCTNEPAIQFYMLVGSFPFRKIFGGWKVIFGCDFQKIRIYSRIGC